MSKKSTLLKILIPLIIILAGFSFMWYLISHREEPRKEVIRDQRLLVHVMSVHNQNHQLIIEGTGTVEPSREISLIPQVSGRVVYVSPNLKAGGFFKENDIILHIDDRDYKLALDQAIAAEAKAEYDLATVESQADIARREWERLSAVSRRAPNPLVTYEPQLRSTKAALSAAKASVQQARLNLERTVLKAPFNVRVRSKDVDIGQYVRAGSPVAVLAGTDSVEISVPMSIDDIQWLKIPLTDGKDSGSPATIRMEAGENYFEWQGRLVRSTGEVDPRTRMINLVVEVKDPYGLSSSVNRVKPPLATGTFVSVRFRGQMLENVFVLPVAALRDNSTVWIMDRDDKLRINEVSILKMEKDAVIISEGLKEGDRIVLSNISGAADGLKLRVRSQESRVKG